MTLAASQEALQRGKLVPELLGEFRKWKLQSPRNPSGLVFVDELGQPWNKKQTYKLLRTTCEKAGVRVLNVHNLCHSFASHCLIAGVPPLKVSHMLGHSKLTTTLDTYSHWSEREECDAEAMLAGRVFAKEPQEEKLTESEIR